MALSDTIATIISRQKTFELCDSLHDAQNATTEEELIEAGLPLVVYAYQTGIVDDALLGSDFTEATLNTYNVFSTGTFTISNPVKEVYIMKEANVTITLSGSNKVKINVMGGGTLTLTAGDTSYATVKLYDQATATVTINDNAMVDIATKDTSTATITNNANGICYVNAIGHSTVNYTGGDSSYCLARVYQNAILNYNTSGSGVIYFKTFNAGQAIGGYLP